MREALTFSYSMKLEFGGGEAHGHAFSLRCLPQETAYQHVKNEQTEVTPLTHLSYGTDGFGNRYCYGTVNENHEAFSVSASGSVSINPGIRETAAPGSVMPYRHFTEKTAPGECLTKMHDRLVGSSDAFGGSVYERALIIRNYVHDSMIYAPGETDPATSAEEAVRRGAGVCQDFAHIMLSLCRMDQIACRYTAGLLRGEGQSHAWVEIFDDGQWIPMDPTNPGAGDDDRLVFSHGRDADDCEINRGIYLGPESRLSFVRAELGPA